MDFGVPADHRVKLKESEKGYRCLNLAREQKKEPWNMKVTLIPIVNGTLFTVTKGLEQGLEDLEIRRRVETIQTTASLRSDRILRRVLDTCYLSASSENISPNAGVKDTQMSKIRKKPQKG